MYISEFNGTLSSSVPFDMTRWVGMISNSHKFKNFIPKYHVLCE